MENWNALFSDKPILVKNALHHLSSALLSILFASDDQLGFARTRTLGSKRWDEQMQTNTLSKRPQSHKTSQHHFLSHLQQPHHHFYLLATIGGIWWFFHKIPPPLTGDSQCIFARQRSSRGLSSRPMRGRPAGDGDRGKIRWFIVFQHGSGWSGSWSLKMLVMLEKTQINYPNFTINGWCKPWHDR